MSNQTQRGIRLMAGALVFIAGAFPANVLDLLKKVGNAASDNPIRAIFILVGVGLIVSAFWDGLLDVLGIRTIKRMFANIKDWLHSTFKYSLISSDISDKTFTIVAEFQSRQYTIEKDATRPVLNIKSIAVSPGERVTKLINNATNIERRTLRENVMLELARLDMLGISVKFPEGNDGFEVSVVHKMVITKEFDAFRLMDGINVAGRAMILVHQVLGKWVTKQLQKAGA